MRFIVLKCPMKSIDNKLIEAEFEKRWTIYPVKIGRIDALKYWKAYIRINKIITIDEFNEFLKLFDLAENNYIDYIHRCWSTNYNRRFKDGSSFFRNWRDYIEPPDKKPKTEKPDKVSEPKVIPRKETPQERELINKMNKLGSEPINWKNRLEVNKMTTKMKALQKQYDDLRNAPQKIGDLLERAKGLSEKELESYNKGGE